MILRARMAHRHDSWNRSGSPAYGFVWLRGSLLLVFVQVIFHGYLETTQGSQLFQSGHLDELENAIANSNRLVEVGDLPRCFEREEETVVALSPCRQDGASGSIQKGNATQSLPFPGP